MKVFPAIVDGFCLLVVCEEVKRDGTEEGEKERRGDRGRQEGETLYSSVEYGLTNLLNFSDDGGASRWDAVWLMENFRSG